MSENNQENKNNSTEDVYTDKEYKQYDEFLAKNEITVVEEDDDVLTEDEYYVIPKSKIAENANNKTYDGTDINIDDSQIHNIQNIRANADKAIALYIQGKVDEAEKIVPNFEEEYGEDIKIKNGNIYVPDYDSICKDAMENIDDNLHRTNHLKAIENGTINQDSPDEMLVDYNMAILTEISKRQYDAIAKDPDGLKNLSSEQATYFTALKHLRELQQEDAYNKDGSTNNKDTKFVLDYVKNLSNEELGQKVVNILESSDLINNPETKNNVENLKQELKNARDNKKQEELKKQQARKNSAHKPLKQQLKNAAQQRKNNNLNSDFVYITKEVRITRAQYEQVLKNAELQQLARKKMQHKQSKQQPQKNEVVKNDAIAASPQKRNAEMINKLRGLTPKTATPVIKRNLSQNRRNLSNDGR
ncbi:MAG: hypothetical protein MSB80_03305 [Alphaproteobacteria bacterium]|nr:hypothetical protein [Alphaproteobacteria bacterium]